MDLLVWRDVLMKAESMRIFAGDDEAFNFGQWRDWHKACQAAGKMLAPTDFKKQPPP